MRCRGLGVVAGLCLLAACAAPAPSPTASTVVATPSPSPSRSAAPAPSPSPSPPASPTVREVERVEVVSVEDVVTGLEAPWGIAFLPDGSALVTERDSARVLHLVDGEVRALGGPGARYLERNVDDRAEGGLLGVAAVEDEVFVYLTTARDNRVLRMPVDEDRLGEPEVVLDRIPRSTHHNGGRLAIGPDGHLYVTTGDVNQRERAQDLDWLGGKILRATLDGEPAPGNPFDSLVWTYGHRNVQGLGWAPDGRMFASEFGQDAWDELNLVEPGESYGWPLVEGSGGEGEHREPLHVWRTSEASPSGLAVTDEGVYLAGLRGETLWRVPLTADGVGEPEPLLQDHGRLRDVVVAPDGALWVLTNNTDGRGTPREGDDRVLRIELAP